jgi:hypothetical protein
MIGKMASIDPQMKINLQLFAGKVKDKADIDPKDLEALKKELGEDDDPDEDEDGDDSGDTGNDDDDDSNSDDGDDDKEGIDEDPDQEDDDPDEDEDSDEPDEDDSDDGEDDEEPAAGKGKNSGGKGKAKPDTNDKKTGAIIALKNENKALKARLDAIEKKQQEKDYESEIETLTARYAQEFIDDGMDEDKAKRKARNMAEDKVENKKVADRLLEIEVDRLEEKGYIDIRSKLDVLKPLTKAGLTLEEAYRAKFGDIKSKAARTKAEQLALANKQNKSNKRIATTTGTTKRPDPVTLSKRDERMFKEMRKKDPSMTRKAFKSLLKDFDD